ncbi:unnamed protein product [Microthlaspi erraticum]|uniref:F-box domain-containing protein n=1 Tax=Microthlaspi erraticum TaxID=1685480 RepID=A0A6D2IPZ1_9BRAS|nr:unnamed protein product [Microthlaspi erraticum]
MTSEVKVTLSQFFTLSKIWAKLTKTRRKKQNFAATSSPPLTVGSSRTLNPSAIRGCHGEFLSSISRPDLMEEGKCGEGSAGFSAAREDLISKLPDSLISQILLYLRTKEAVRTSVLSKRWKSVWRLIPGLDLDSSLFPNYCAFVSFVERLLGFYREEKSCLHKLELFIVQDWKIGNDQHRIARWIDFVATRKLEHLHVGFRLAKLMWREVMPLSLYVCETLLHLTLYHVSLGSFKSVSLPRLKTMQLGENVYVNEASLELLISSCPVLEDLSIVRRPDDNVKVLRVHSQSLTRLHIELEFCVADDEVEGSVEDFDDENSGILIDAPRLKYLTFENEHSPSKIISNPGSLTKVRILGEFRLCTESTNEVDLQKRYMVRNFFTSISGVRVMNISCDAFQLIDNIMPSPQFCKLSRLEAELKLWSLGSVPKILASCPNLRSLVLYVHHSSVTEQIGLSFVPQCLLSSLKFVVLNIISAGGSTEILKIARYFAKNGVMLKKLVLRSCFSIPEEDLIALQRRSSSCQIVYARGHIQCPFSYRFF